MKVNKKFIAIGLGLAIPFTGTYFSYSWFNDSANLSHRINIEKLIEEVAQGNIPVRFGCLHDNDHKEITINMNDIVDGQITDFKVEEGTGQFKNVEEDEVGKGDKINQISIENERRFGDIGEFSDDNMIIIEITRKHNGKVYRDTYKLQFRIKGNSIEARYTLISSKLKETLNDDKSDNTDVLPPTVPEEGTAPPNNEENSPEEENPPTEEKPSDKEENDNSSEDKTEKPEEKPSKPETDKPSNGEGTQNPEQPKPEVVEPPKSESQPDTPTPLPLEE